MYPSFSNNNKINYKTSKKELSKQLCIQIGSEKKRKILLAIQQIRKHVTI